MNQPIRPHNNFVDYCENSSFDVCLKNGIKIENKVVEYLVDKKLECKGQSKAHKKGCVLVEYKMNGKPSGISTTKSDAYVFIFTGLKGFRSIIIDTVSLKKLCRKIYKEDPINNILDLSKDKSNGGTMIIVPLIRLLTEA